MKKAVSVFSSSSFTWINNVNRIHATTPKVMFDGGTYIGKVGFSVTKTKQNKDSGLLYSYSDIGNESTKYGVGLNLKEWVGIGVGVSSEVNVYAEAQLTPWLHAEVSIGLDGVGGIIGVNADDTSYDFELKCGWGIVIIGMAPELLGRSMSQSTY